MITNFGIELGQFSCMSGVIGFLVTSPDGPGNGFVQIAGQLVEESNQAVGRYIIKQFFNTIDDFQGFVSKSIFAHKLSQCAIPGK